MIKQGYIKTNYLHDEKTNVISVDHDLWSETGTHSPEVLYRVYLSLGSYLRDLCISNMYDIEKDAEFVKEMHSELKRRLENDNNR